MFLRTLGGLQLQGSVFTRPKPLLLLGYLALEGARDRQHVGDLFFGHTSDHMNSLRTTLKRLRHEAPGSLEVSGDALHARVPCDAAALFSALEAGDLEGGVRLYTGAFLEGIRLSDWNDELEEWVYSTRELIAVRVRAALLTLAEREAANRQFEVAATLAERACWLEGAPDPEPEEYARIGTLLIAGQSPLVGRVRQQAQTFGIALQVSLEEAQRRLRDVPAYALVTLNRASRAAPLGTLRIGMTGFLNLPFLSHALEEFHRTHGGVQIAVQELFSPQQIQALKDGTLDVGFVTLPVNDAEIHCELAWQEPYWLLLPETHALAALPEIPLEALRDETFLLHPRAVNAAMYDHILSLLRHNGLEPPRILEGSSPQTRNNLVASGLGWTLTLPSWPAALPGLVKKPIRSTQCHHPLVMEGAMAWHRDNASALRIAFAEIVRVLKPLEG